MKFKQYFPKRLFARFLLIIVLPLFIVQLISIYIFYQSHLQNVVKRISRDTIQKIIFIDKNFKANEDYGEINLGVKFNKSAKLKSRDIIRNTNKYVFFNQEQFFIDSLLNSINEPIAVKDIGENYVISIQKHNGLLNISVNKKELVVKTARVFVMWNIILSLLTLSIAIIFMKNQLKPIKLLKQHVKIFSLTQNISKFKPTGAKEIRELSISFIEMEKRLKKFVDQRTIILAGISHDLRTPLTRMRLELEMMDSPSKKYLSEDIDYMEKIINQYLNFTKESKNEEKELTNIYDYLKIFVKEYNKINKNISFQTKNIDKDEIVLIQTLQFKRVLYNIVGNAFKFGKKAIITLIKTKNNKKIIISIDDDGCGVNDKDIEKLTEPFFKADKSRNFENSGVGLGLAIAKDIILMNNGTISFNKSKKLCGLNVQVGLDIIQENFI